MKSSLFLILVFFTYSCTTKSAVEDDFDDSILVQIDDYIILKNEFIQRAEYVLRPDYCSKNNNIHKQIILNSLIAEKLLAIEGEGLFNDKPINNYLKGLREQNMREKLFFTKTSSKEIDSFELNQFRKTADRIYNLSFINLNKTQAEEAMADINISPELTNRLFNAESSNTKDVSFFGENSYRLCYEIFSKQLNKYDVVGPVRMDDGTYILMRIEDWYSERKLSESSQKEYINNIRAHLNRLRTIDNYGDYIHKIMKNKTLNFNQVSFSKLIKNFYYEQLQFEKSKKDLFKKAIWSENKLVLTGEYRSIDIDGNEIIFSIDDEEWSMDKLQKLFNVHPLVFRNKKISKKDFPIELKNAIADLIRDYYLTKEAYTVNLDKDSYINQYIKMWKEHFIASAVRVKLLQSKPTDNEDIEFLEPMINQLFHQYSDKIIINFKLLDEINLTSIPMHIVNQNAAYQSPIPQFPILTDNYKINYGARRK
jgi:hypothetical protein